MDSIDSVYYQMEQKQKDNRKGKKEGEPHNNQEETPNGYNHAKVLDRNATFPRHRRAVKDPNPRSFS
jgi:hypothetical protein